MNPSGQPFPGPLDPPPSNPSGNARDAVNVPGILFMIVGGLTVLSALWSFISRAMRGAGMDEDQLAQLQKTMSDPNMPKGFKDFMASMVDFLNGPLPLVLNGVSLLLGALILVAGFQMRQLKAFPLVVAGAVATMLPTTFCCCLTLPLGIWALVTVNRGDVRAAFS